MSLSSPSNEGSIATLRTACLHVIVIFTRPAPDWPSTSIFASSSCALRMFSCICCACFMSWPSPPFIMGSPLVAGWLARRLFRRTNGGRNDLGPEVAHEVAHERVGLDALFGARLALRHLARFRGGDAVAVGAAHLHREPQARPEVRREVGLELVEVRLLRVHAMRFGHDELEMV